MLTTDRKMFIASADGREICLNAGMGNRHGLVAGATGTGKTVTLQRLAEAFSALGTPVFLTDVKGDLAGLSQKGAPEGGLASRIKELGLADKGYANQAYPVCFWDVVGTQGHPLRAVVSDLGPLLFSRLLELNEVQTGLMHLVFRIADDQGLLLLDLKDLRGMINYVGENKNDFQEYGHISQASLGAIQRGLLRLEEEGAEFFLGEPSLRIEDFLLTDLNGRGQINILAADRLVQTPRLYATLLLWLLSELFENLPEIGDPEKPRLVLMFDEAHLIFANAPGALLEKMEQVVRLIRSKGVGVYFITQNPMDVPSNILTQLGNRVQHALRAFSPSDQKAVRAAAQTFRANPAFKTEDTITSLGIGEALVSFLDPKGMPAQVERALILPPESRVGLVSPEERAAVIKSSQLSGRYDVAVDRESAYEILAGRHAARQEEGGRNSRSASRKGQPEGFSGMVQDVAQRAARTLSTTIGREVGKSIMRGLLGGIFGRKK